MRVACLVVVLACASASTALGADEAHDRRSYGRTLSQVVSLLRASDFDALDSLYARLSTPPARTRDGTWMPQAFPVAIDAAFTASPVAEVEDTFAEWKRRKPGSTLRSIAEAFAWQSRAWRARGDGCYAEMSSASRRAFDSLVARAADSLRGSVPDAAGSVLWYEAAILVAGGQGRPAGELDRLLAEAVARYPGYEPLYAARMKFLLPAWGGSFEAVDGFVRRSARETQPLEGRALYAWLYLDLAAAGGCDRLFDDSLVSWDEMRPAFEDMVARHPDAWNLNVFATFACRARDAATTARLLGQLGADARLGAWSQGVSTESCRRMVHDANLQVRGAGQEAASAFR